MHHRLPCMTCLALLSLHLLESILLIASTGWAACVRVDASKDRFCESYIPLSVLPDNVEIPWNTVGGGVERGHGDI